MRPDVLTNTPGRTISNAFENVRIEPVDDPKINNALFSLFSHLISPFEEIESTRRKIESKQSEILKINGEISDSFRRILKTNIPFGILMLASVFGVAFLIGDDNAYLHFWNQYTHLCEKLVFGMFDTSDINLFLGFIQVILYVVIWLGGMWLSTVPIAVTLVILKNRSHKSKIAKIEAEIEELELSIKNKIDDISDVVVFVPPAYRHSEALSYFVDSYANSRVSNLKEAVNCYDTFIHRRKVEGCLARIEEALSCLAYQQQIQNDQLEYISRWMR